MPELKEFNLTMKPEGQSTPMTREQLMAAERDAKRRRVKHRSAKVHTKSKNYSEVLREVINNQMLAYEDWIKENFGNVNLTESAQPEMQKAEEAKQEKQEMIWLDYDFWSNPHTRWKSILEKEKRRKEKGEKDEECEKVRIKEREKSHKDRKRDKDGSRSKTHHHREEFRKRGSDDKHKSKNFYGTESEYDHDEASYSRKGSKSSQRESHHLRTESHHSRKESHHSKKDSHHSRKDSHHSRSREDRLEEKHFKTERHQRYWDEDDFKSKSATRNDDEEYKSKYRKKDNPYRKGSDREVDYFREEKYNSSKRKWDRYDGFQDMEHKQGKRIKEENTEDAHNISSNSHKSHKNVKLKKEYESESTESEYD